jgi:hypothetical protein
MLTFFQKIRLGINTDIDPLLSCPDAPDGVITPREYDLICTLGCGSFNDNSPKKLG